MILYLVCDRYKINTTIGLLICSIEILLLKMETYNTVFIEIRRNYFNLIANDHNIIISLLYLHLFE